jgi:hypothetical protein
LLVVAHLRNGETYPDLAGGFGIGTTTVFRYIREALDVLAALAAALSQAIEAARRKAFVVLVASRDVVYDVVAMSGVASRMGTAIA